MNLKWLSAEPASLQYQKQPNAQLSSEQRTTKAAALRLKHKTHRKPKLPRVANLLELFVMRFFGNAKLTNENITLNTKNYKRTDSFL
ncbi:hypothetical protein ACVHCY_004417 [Vibrio parahaemolyticus]